ncbi:hypothetical protein Tco_1549368 [Tanacetum coccineum]
MEYLCLHSPKTTKETRSNTPYPEKTNTSYSSYRRLANGIVDFRNEILTICPDLITFNDDSDDELDALLGSLMCPCIVEEASSMLVEGDLSNHEESDSDDDEEYYMKRNEMGKPFYGPNRAKYLNCDDPMDRALALQDAINPFRKFDEGVTDEELITKKLIKFRLKGHRNSLSLFEFARHLSLYNSAKICEEGYEWLKRKGVGAQRESMICCGLFVTRMAKKIRLLTDEVLDGLSAPIYCRSLDAATLRELIGPNRRLITKDLTPGVPRFAMPRPPRPKLKDLYDRMGRMEIQQGVLERISRMQSHHSDRYAGFFEFMAGHYRVPLVGAYAPPGYDKEWQEHE